MIHSTGFVLQYPNGDLVGLENGKGPYSAEVYPFRSTKIGDIEIFPTREDAEGYCKTYKEMGFRITRITIKVVLDSIE